MLPAVLREFAKIDKDAVLVGVGSRIEIWNKAVWNEKNVYDDMEDIDASANDKKDDNDDSLLYSIYIFDSLSQVIDVSRLIAPTFKGDSSVYKSPFNDKYYLSLCVEASQGKKLNRIYSILTEHGVRENPTYAKELFYMEHFDEILANKAIETLGAL